MQNFNFPSNDYTYNNMGTGQALKDGRGTEYSTANESKLIGYFGRLNYSYKGKYMFAASLRHEGSTKFWSRSQMGQLPICFCCDGTSKENSSWKTPMSCPS